jgi:hypothetical protein
MKGRVVMMVKIAPIRDACRTNTSADNEAIARDSIADPAKS